MDGAMARKRHKPEEIVTKPRRVEVLTGQDASIAEAVKTIAVTETTYFRWRAEYGGMKSGQVISADAAIRIRAAHDRENGKQQHVRQLVDFALGGTRVVDRDEQRKKRFQ